MTTATGIYLDTPAFRKAAKEFTSATGKDLHLLTTEVMRVLVETLYHWTAPPTKGNMGSRGGREGGKAMVKDDIYKAAEGRELGYINFLYERFGSNIESAELYKKGTKTKYQLLNVQVDPSGNDVDAYHRGKRNNRGNVIGNKTQKGGNVSGKLFTTYDRVAKHIAETQKRVGKMKAGWGEALRQLKSKLPPAWVDKAGSMPGHFGLAVGTYSENLDTENWSGDLTALNKTPYSRDQDGLQRRAHEYVQKNVLQKRMETWLESMIKKHAKVQ
jgi:hypothetical protein